ncbi:hypothetical protein MNBD_ACTINO01-812 [hydrothermal vent metagenome]|uniref:Phage protein n=1 Tax=hydrothermal vent metagenome TaxID=652676 RepID=A0A3B0SGB0_9ZZZZ
MGAEMTARYTLVFYAEASGREPLADFLRNLEPHKRASLVAALSEILAHQGVDVCATEYGKHLGKGLAEFRLRHSYDEIIKRFPDGEVVRPPVRRRGGSVLLRVFFHAYGDKRVLLLGGYDKGRRSSKRKQEAEIARARKRLREFQSRTT